MVENAIQFIRIGRTNASGAFAFAKSKVVTLKQSVMEKNIPSLSINIISVKSVQKRT